MKEPDNGMKAALVVDDSDAVRAVVGQTLLAIGYRVFEAATTAEALSILAAGSVFLIISDLNLDGESSGAMLLAEAKRLHPELKCILMSGSMPPGQQLRVPYRVLSKPFAPKALAELIDRLVRDVDSASA